MLMATQSEKTLGASVYNLTPKDLSVPTVGVPGYSCYMKYKASKKELLCRYLLKHMYAKVAEAELIQGVIVLVSLTSQVP